MEPLNNYTPFILTAIVLVFIIGAELSLVFLWSERSRRKDERETAAFLRYMHIESQKNSKEVQRMIDKNHEDATSFIKAMHKDTALILGRIFEIVDDPEKEKG